MRPHPIRDGFPAIDTLPEPTRRGVLKAMGASIALMAAGCDDGPPAEAVPYVRQPENLVPGRPRFYATATVMDGYAQPVVAEVHMGRPTRLDGHGQSAANPTAASVFTQAEALSLYDPDRLPEPVLDGEPVTRAALDTRLAELADTLAGTKGAGLRLLTGPVTAPTTLRLMDDLRARLPEMRVHRWAPLADGRTEAAARAFGRPLEIRADIAAAGAVVCVGADPLGPGPAQMEQAGAWAVRRRAMLAGERRVRPVLVAEAAKTLTGARADHRLAVREGRMPLLLDALAELLGLHTPDAPADLTLIERAWVARATEALVAPGRPGLLLAGERLPVAAQARALSIAARLGQFGTTLRAVEPVTPPPSADEGLQALVDAMAAGTVETLVMLDVDPVHAAPRAWGFGALLELVPLTIHLGRGPEATSLAARWRIPTLHALESWGDPRGIDGTVHTQQPTVRPLVQGLQAAELLAALAGEPRPAQALVRETWAGHWPAERFEEAWTAALRQGLIPDTAAAAVTPSIAADLPPADGGSAEVTETGVVEVLFRPDPTVLDGRHAGNAWLQELPKPFTAATWGNLVWIGTDLAAELGVATGEAVTVRVGEAAVSGPAWVSPDQAPGTVVLHLGYGPPLPAGAADAADGLGHDAYALRPAEAPWRAAGTIAAGGVADPPALALASTAGPPPAPLIRTVPLVEPVLSPEPRRTQGPGLYDRDGEERWTYPVNAWAMTIDLDACIGCNACVIACQAENNVPTVGREEVMRGRAMHWLRVETYGDDFLPVLCMHCEKAPCEVGCPVHATVHGPDGLNQMIYNRCIGTRTCAAYCPYEVRRFNYLDYADRVAGEAGAQWNPDVTVRARGVMEKCTFCVQRISAARIQAKMDGRPIADGEIRTACQSACPTDVFSFGDLNDPDSAVARAQRLGRSYGLLVELGTEPRTRYLAKVDTGTA